MEPSELDDWAATASRALGVSIEHGDIAAILDLARDAAHGVERPAAPLAAFALGLSVGRAEPGDPDVSARCARIAERAAAWPIDP